MNHRGTSLIEVLVYITLYSVLIGGIMVGVYSITVGSSRTEEHALIGLEGEFIVSTLEPVLADGESSVSVTDHDLYVNGEQLNGSRLAVDNFAKVSTGTPSHTEVTFRLSATSSDGRRVSEDFFLSI